MLALRTILFHQGRIRRTKSLFLIGHVAVIARPAIAGFENPLGHPNRIDRSDFTMYRLFANQEYMTGSKRSACLVMGW